MKILYCTLLSIFISCFAQAQQVTKIDCCVDISGKASIIINDNNSNASTLTTSPVNTTTVNGGFDFKLDVAASTSAGVYNTNDALIRTLWSGVRYEAGCYSGKWDGYLDDGATLAALGSYTVKVVSNNILPTWEGSIGNTSLNMTGEHIHKGYFPMTCIALTAGKLFYGSGYSEAQSSYHYATLDNIQYRSDAVNHQTTMSTYDVCTDGVTVYWTGSDANSAAGTRGYFIWGTDLDNNLKTFSNGSGSYVFGQGFGTGEYYPGTIGLTKSGTSEEITSIAVQTNGSYLFGSKTKVGKLVVYNKNTGAIVSTVSIPNIGAIACDYSNGIWIATSTRTASQTNIVPASTDGKIQKYTINANGTLTATNIVINNYTSVRYPHDDTGGTTVYARFAISQATGELALTDMATNQLKFYNTSTGTLNFTLGQLNGYASGPAVTYDKFMLYALRDGSVPFVAFQPDGSFWLGDEGNFRCLHFNANKTYKEQIAYLGRCRSVTVDMNDPTRIFANHNEFKRDYSKPVGGTNGSWNLANNWCYGLSYEQVNDYTGFYQVATLANGRTYANGTELTATGLRSTNTGAGGIDKYGNSYRRRGFTGNGQTDQIYRNLRIGFDALGNPTYAGETTYLNCPIIDGVTPAYGGDALKMHDVTGSKWVFSNLKNYQGFHNGVVNVSNPTVWAAVFTPSTFKDYSGSYPRDGTLDIGNTKNDDNAVSHYIDNYIIWNDHGEFYKGGSEQPNIWNMFSDGGLFLVNFGEEVRSPGGITAAPWEAGNTFSSGIVKNGNDYYGYYCDESYHSGVGAFKISNTASINTASIPVTVSAAISKAPDPTYLMADVPFQANPYISTDWISTPINFTSNWNVRSNVLSFKRLYPDLYITANENSDHTIARSLGTNNTNNWSLTGKLAWQGSPSYQNANNARIQIVDNTGKAIVNFTINSLYGGDYTNKALFNNQELLSTTDLNMSILRSYPSDFTIKCVNGVLSMTYIGNTIAATGVFTTGANFSTPNKFSVILNGGGMAISVSELKFKTN